MKSRKFQIREAPTCLPSRSRPRISLCRPTSVTGRLASCYRRRRNPSRRSRVLHRRPPASPTPCRSRHSSRMIPRPAHQRAVVERHQTAAATRTAASHPRRPRRPSRQVQRRLPDAKTPRSRQHFPSTLVQLLVISLSRRTRRRYIRRSSSKNSQTNANRAMEPEVGN